MLTSQQRFAYFQNMIEGIFSKLVFCKLSFDTKFWGIKLKLKENTKLKRTFAKKTSQEEVSPKK